MIRACKLIQNIEREHHGFSAYRSLADCMPWLRREGIVHVVDPAKLRSVDDNLTVAATLSDLSDTTWTGIADPRGFGLPTQFFHDNGPPCWNIFRPKIPNAVVEALKAEGSLSHHLLHDGGDKQAWALSYAAGSAIGINVHLAAADELGLAPVTDSRLHHELMLMKLARESTGTVPSLRVETYADQVAQHAIVKLLGEILPNEKMEQLSLEDILRFREETAEVRRQFLADVRHSVLSEIDLKNPDSHLVTERKVVDGLLKSSKLYSDEIAGTRDRLWPTMIRAFTGKVLMGTSAAGLAASYISSSGYVLAASVLVAALQPLKVALEWRADLKKVQRTASSAIAYLSQVKALR